MPTDADQRTQSHAAHAWRATVSDSMRKEERAGLAHHAYSSTSTSQLLCISWRSKNLTSHKATTAVLDLPTHQVTMHNVVAVDHLQPTRHVVKQQQHLWQHLALYLVTLLLLLLA